MSQALHPDQQRALSYLERKGTALSAAEVRRALAETFRALEEVLVPLSAGVVGRSPGAGQWSVAAVVDHLIASHRPAVEQLRRLLQGENPGAAIPAHLRTTTPARWSDLLAGLQRVHSDFLSVLDGVGEADSAASLEPKVPVAMVIKMDGEPVEWIADLDWKAYVAGVRVHILEHQQQVARILGAVTLDS